jgi:heme/copper-type cytochrome/quinol oxidase subunit 2
LGSKQLLKLRFTDSTDQIRELNENVKITYIQKKTEPVAFTTGLRKYETVFDNKNLYREFDTVVTGHEDSTYQKLRIRKDKENLLSLKKKQAFRREVRHSKRLLWVTKQIVLPIRTPITIITNSYDVIHSWFIPGLGLKMDCVPGRSTHHTIFIDKPGYYYGQCAEVCGRRHHHMPIKILAVPFVHFLY